MLMQHFDLKGNRINISKKTILSFAFLGLFATGIVFTMIGIKENTFEKGTLTQYSSTVYLTSQTDWEFWNGTAFLQIDAAGLHPSYQNATYGLVTYTYDNAGNRDDEVYIRYRAGFDFTWSDYQTEKVVLV